jgi:hypothetical protein
MTTVNEDHLQMISDCEDRESMLSEWEINFLESISIRLEGNGSLSEKQGFVLDRIFEKATRKG